MGASRWLQRVALLAMLLISTSAVHAQRLDRVRSDSEEMRLVISDALQRSPTFRAIVERLQASDLIVEVQCGYFRTTRLAGRTALLSARPNVRYVLVEISCTLPAQNVIGTLGHELRHALEIASAPWVVDEPTLHRLYTRIGFSTCGVSMAFSDEFETAEALEAGARVHHELFHPSASTRVAQLMTK